MNVSLQAAKYRAKLLPIILLVCFMIMNVVLAYGQGNLVSKLKDLKKMVEVSPIEKIHIQTNQPYYSAGDTLWLKSYIIEASSNLPSNASKTLNVSLYGPTGDLVQQVKTKVKVGLSSGYISLPLGLGAGTYILSAFTENMDRYGREHHFQRTVIVKGGDDYDNAHFKRLLGSGRGEPGAVLPKVLGEKRYKLLAATKNDSIQLDLRDEELSSNFGSLTVIGSQDGITRYIKKLRGDKSGLRLSVPKASFYTGLVQFTIFDEADLPLAEQLIFCDHKAFLDIDAEVEAQYRPQERTKIKVKVRNAAGQDDVSSLAVSIYSLDAFPTDEKDESSIFSELLLTSDLNGVIKNSNAYFMDVENGVAEEALQTMLSGRRLRRFSWMDKLSRVLPMPKPIVDERAVVGTVLLANGKPLVAGEVVLVQDGVEKQVYTTSTDSLGQFAFKDLNFWDTVNFLVSTPLKGARIVIDAADTSLANASNPTSGRPSVASKGLENGRVAITSKEVKVIDLQQVQIKGKKINPVVSSANLNGPGKADVIILAKDLETTHDISTYLINRVNGLKIYQGRVYSRDIPEEGQMLSPPPAMLLVLDGTMLSQETYNIDEINPNDVQSIEVLKGASAAIYGINGMGGVLVISLKRGRDHSSASVNGKFNGIVSLSRTGFQREKQFYIPKPEQLPAGMQDKRRVLYWNPNLVSSTAGVAELEYVNPGYAGKFKVVIEGINGDGQIGRSIYFYEVK